MDPIQRKNSKGLVIAEQNITLFCNVHQKVLAKNINKCMNEGKARGECDPAP